MKRLLTGLAGIVLAAGILSGCGGSSTTEVTTAIAKTDGDVSSLSWHGNIEAAKTVEVLPGDTGKVQEITVAEGGRVNAGDVLFTLDNTDAALSLKQAEANSKAAQAAFTNADAANAENTTVKPAQITYNDAAANYERMQVLFSGGDISQVDFDNAKSKMDIAAAQLQAAKNGQQGSYDSTKAQLESAEAALEIAQKRLNDCAVTAPISGLLTKVNIVTGQTVSPQLSAVTIMDDSSEDIVIQVADMDIAQVRKDQKMNVYLQAPEQTCEGTVREISPVCDPKTGMFQVKVAINKPEQSYTGLSADVTVSEDQAASSLYIPAKCVAQENEKSYVYLVANGIAVKTEISAGKKKNAYMEIVSGLSVGDEVVMQSSKELSDNMAVHVISAK